MIPFNKKSAPIVFAFLSLAQAITKTGSPHDEKTQHIYLTDDQKLVVTDSKRMAVFDFDYPGAKPGYYKVIKISPSDMAIVPTPDVEARYPDYTRVLLKTPPIAGRIGSANFSIFFCQTIHLVEDIILDVGFVREWHKFLEGSANIDCLVRGTNRNSPVQFETPECRYALMPMTR